MNDHADTLRMLRAEYAQRLDAADPPCPELRAYDAAIAALEAGRNAEPVAWMYEHDGSNAAPTFTRKRWMRSGEPWTETPLYAAAPQQPAPSVSDEDAAEAYRKAHAAGEAHGVKACIAWVEKRRHDFEEQYGSVDPSTNAMEFGTVEREEYDCELAEIEEGLRGLLTPSPVSEPAASGEGYDRELIAAMLETVVNGRLTLTPDVVRDFKDQMRLLREADAIEARRLTTTGKGDVERWQPIETAPESKGPFFFCRLAWGPEEDQSTADGYRWKGRWFAAPVFHAAGQERTFQHREVEVHPTHWMPMPATPFTQQQEGR